MEIVLGMAKSAVHLKPGQARALELDFLRLVYAKQRLEARGDVVHAFLAVITDEIRARCETWAAKYEAPGEVEILVVELTPEQAEALRDEKARNVSGMIAGSQGQPAGEDSAADLGKVIAEDFLDWFIEGRFGPLNRTEREDEMPFKVRWDYYGQASGQASGLDLNDRDG